MATKSALKRELILDRAKQVFIRKGFNRVTMKDIVEERSISRGGVYLYFSTVDEICQRRFDFADFRQLKNAGKQR